jgi:hypothetical protein
VSLLGDDTLMNHEALISNNPYVQYKLWLLRSFCKDGIFALIVLHMGCFGFLLGVVKPQCRNHPHEDYLFQGL